jgi:hypothetical protein
MAAKRVIRDFIGNRFKYYSNVPSLWVFIYFISFN